MTALVLSEDHGAVRVLTLNAPETLNALSDGMLAALSGAFDGLERDRDRVRAVVLKGAGRAFCAGHHLGEMRAARAGPDKGRAALSDLFETCSALMQRIQHLPQPVIAEVHGIATAAGCQLVASCDLAVAAASTRFGVNGVNIGLFCSTPMIALTRNVGRKRAFEMLTTGGFLSADEAVAAGLINRAVEDGTEHVAAMTLAETIAGKLGSAVRIGKRVFYAQAEMSLAEAYDHARDAMVENMLDDDTAEGIAAFIEKRRPGWQA